MSVLLVSADKDSVSQKHVAEFFALLGGGVKERGWRNTELSKSRLAGMPSYRHCKLINSRVKLVISHTGVHFSKRKTSSSLKCANFLRIISSGQSLLRQSNECFHLGTSTRLRVGEEFACPFAPAPSC